MRMVIASVCLLLLAAVAASAAHVDPQALVLHQADVPNGFELDRDDSGLRSNESEAKGDRRLPGLFRRWGRVTGYEMEFDRREASISSRADLFRTPEGARLVLAFLVDEFEKSGIQGLRRSPLRIGAKGWLYGAKPVSSPFNIVIWRHDRAFAGIAVFGLTRPQTLALARAQQRRIAAALG
jgi:hypothetical protein